MDSASLVLSALGIVFLLQIITILQIKNIYALLKSHQGRRPESSSEKYSRKDRKPRENKRTGKQQVSDTPLKKHAQISSVDKSLRDINLRLKNAERDQERARKKLGTKEQKDSGKRSGREQGRNRGSDRDQDRDQDRDRDHVRKPIQRRNKDSSQNVQRKVPAEANGDKKPQSVSPPPAAREEVSLESLQTAPVVNPEVKVTSPAESSFGRGAPVAVKRRNLESKPKQEMSDEKAVENKPEEKISVEQPPVINKTPAPEVKAPENIPSEEVAVEQPPKVNETQAPKEHEVSFGRR